MFFNSVKEINRSRKEINRLLIKGMSNILLKVTGRTNVFSSLTNLSPGQFLWSCNSCRYPWILKLLKLKNQKSGSKTACGFSVILLLKGIMTF